MTTGYVKVKEWVIDKMQNTAERYNTYIDIYREWICCRKSY